MIWLTYFRSKFIVKRNSRDLADLDGKSKHEGSTSEQNAEGLPKATVLSFDDYPQALLASSGQGICVTTDDRFAKLLANAPNKEQRNPTSDPDGRTVSACARATRISSIS
jgi:polar amino acid transport system substrate-binding protein